MTGNRTEGRGTLSRTWRGALNAGIRAEGADDKLAHALRPNRLAPFAQADLGPSTNRPQHRCETRNESAGQANIERLRETDLRDRRRNRIAGNGVHRPAAGIRQSSSQGRVTPGFTRTARKLSSRAGACGGGGNPAAGSHAGIRESTWRAGSAGHKKAPLRRTAPFPHNYGRKPDPP